MFIDKNKYFSGIDKCYGRVIALTKLTDRIRLKDYTVIVQGGWIGWIKSHFN